MQNRGRATAPAVSERAERQRFRLVTLSPSDLPTMAATFPEDFVTSGIRAADGRLVGFVSTIHDGDGAVAYFIGFDRELAATGVPLYLRLLASGGRGSDLAACAVHLLRPHRARAQSPPRRRAARSALFSSGIASNRGLLETMSAPNLPPSGIRFGRGKQGLHVDVSSHRLHKIDFSSVALPRCLPQTCTTCPMRVRTT